ncbi:MAG TPA: FAD-dependent oxidoreductase [Cyclobacteriaceae bacterium]|nr:FAD-dependent oxidoreductase [Cyclobacteriaceae bacterium]
MKLRSPEPYWLLKNGLGYSYPSLKEDVQCDILVVGGGITGALLAFQLSGEGHSTVLMDKNDVSLGSTAATTAILQYELDEPLYSLIDKVGEDAAVDTYRHGISMIDWLSDLVHRHNFNCGFEVKNSVYFARNEADVDGLRKEFECREKYGFGVSWLTGNQLLKNYHTAGHGAIVSDKAASVDAYSLAHQLLHYSVTHSGLRVFDHTEMKEVAYDGAHHFVLTDEDYQVTCKRIVYSTGYETQAFLNEPVAKLISTYALISEPLQVLPPAISTSVFWDTSDPYFYMRCTPDNRLLIGGVDEPFTDPGHRDSLIEEKERELVNLFKTALPDMSITPDYSWAGTFGVTKDSMPYIGMHPDHHNSFFALGYGGNGITFSLMAMEMLSDTLAGKKNRYNEYFRFNR